ncbi:HTH domain-containing protein [Streptomyces soliscabiei]|uniref:HTH domain-containing protein n=1 Tax=Streptomyces soliscabiei TaxID=588897 RepID=UPI0029B73385|nr:HTH domain-containing protein [Streptomyces sp. NY05-11A]MDX2681075.1 HTH domain-containing protein [Streptomyces sp. NY05-11A]
MSPSSARALRRARVAQLAREEPDLSHRQMGQRLGISRMTVTRDLAELARDAAQPDPPAEAATAGAVARSEPLAHAEPQVTASGTPAVAQPVTPPPLPRLVAAPLDGVDLSKWPAVRRDLAVLAQSGLSAEAVAHQAIVATAFAYRQAIARGDLQPGQPFLIRDVRLVQAARRADYPQPDPTPAEGA